MNRGSKRVGDHPSVEEKVPVNTAWKREQQKLEEQKKIEEQKKLKEQNIRDGFEPVELDASIEHSSESDERSSMPDETPSEQSPTEEARNQRTR
ncbi:hypothetical protein FRC09_007594 [Ceratobasidium sp. 395]|nr:hypothetical protein FRC09_007594 [Ceratobasidium sp. 395]